MHKYKVLLITVFNIILVASRAVICKAPTQLLIFPYSPIVPTVPAIHTNTLGSGRQFNSAEGENDANITVVFEHLHTIWPMDESVLILWTGTEVDWKYLPKSVFDDINHHLKYYYVLLQRKGYSLYKVVKKALLHGKPLQSDYSVAFKPIGNFSINFGFTFNIGTSGNLNFS